MSPPLAAEKLQNFFGVFLQFHIGVDIYASKEAIVLTAEGQIQPIFHVSEEALLRCVVPTVGFPRHGLTQLIVSDGLNGFQAGVVGTMIAVDQGFCL